VSHSSKKGGEGGKQLASSATLNSLAAGGPIASAEGGADGGAVKDKGKGKPVARRLSLPASTNLGKGGKGGGAPIASLKDVIEGNAPVPVPAPATAWVPATEKKRKRKVQAE
jgi:hypothetical protein